MTSIKTPAAVKPAAVKPAAVKPAAVKPAAVKPAAVKPVSGLNKRRELLQASNLSVLVARQFGAGASHDAAAIAAKQEFTKALAATNTTWAAALIQGVIKALTSEASVKGFDVTVKPSLAAITTWHGAIVAAMQTHATNRKTLGKQTGVAYTRAAHCLDALSIIIDRQAAKQAGNTPTVKTKLVSTH